MPSGNSSPKRVPYLTSARDAPLSIHFAVGGFQPFSASDWPDHLAAVIFAQGCPLRCSYCHNPHLIPRNAGDIPFHRILDKLSRRRTFLDGVVFSGGEPCAQHGLPDAIASVRHMQLQVGLHTAGAYPAMLKRVLPLLDWVGLDVKAPEADYARISGSPAWRRTEQSLNLLIANHGIFEVRTTWNPDLFDADRLFDLAQNLSERGVAHYAVQRLRRPVGDSRTQCWETGPAPPADLLTRLATLFSKFTLR